MPIALKPCWCDFWASKDRSASRHDDQRQGMKPEILFAFGRDDDARVLAGVIQAETTSGRAGWASERAVDLKMAALDAISARLPPPRPSRRSPA
jgi:hypothetical protein